MTLHAATKLGRILVDAFQHAALAQTWPTILNDAKTWACLLPIYRLERKQPPLKRYYSTKSSPVREFPRAMYSRVMSIFDSATYSFVRIALYVFNDSEPLMHSVQPAPGNIVPVCAEHITALPLTGKLWFATTVRRQVWITATLVRIAEPIAKISFAIVEYPHYA
jgi:hypothetical protein